MATAKQLLCHVCGEVPHKYRCPTCADIRYCSARCFAAHKPGCLPSSSSSSRPGGAGAGTSSSHTHTHNNDDNDDDDALGVTFADEEEERLVRLSEDRLRRLAEDPSLLQALRDPRARKALLAVDKAGSGAARVAALDAARRSGSDGEEFTRLIDRMLVAIGVAERDAETGDVTFIGLPSA